VKKQESSMNLEKENSMRNLPKKEKEKKLLQLNVRKRESLENKIAQEDFIK
jgi:hypothetical protein